METEGQEQNNPTAGGISPANSLTALTTNVSSSPTESLISKGVNLKVKESDLVDKPICRICFAGSSRERLLKPCKCKGTIEFVHRHCLERWLGSTSYEACELCRFQYATVRTPKSFWEWCRQDDTRDARRNVVADFICFAFLTPLGLGTMWLCAQGVAYYQKMKTGTIESTALVALAVFLSLSYLAWVVLCTRYHFMMWKRWRSRNCNVRVLDRLPNSREDMQQVVDIDLGTRSQSPTSSQPLIAPWSDCRGRSAWSDCRGALTWSDCRSAPTQTTVVPLSMADSQFAQVLSSLNLLYDSRSSSV